MEEWKVIAISESRGPQAEEWRIPHSSHFSLYYEEIKLNATYENKTDIHLHAHAQRDIVLNVSTDDNSTNR